MKIRIPRPRGYTPADGSTAQTLPNTIEAPLDKLVTHIDFNAFAAMLADIATNAWRAQWRLRTWPQQEEAAAERKRLERNVDAILTSLEAFGVQIKDHIGEVYDYGQGLKVVAAEPQDGISREVVRETIRPTVAWNDMTIQRAEVVIATPREQG